MYLGDALARYHFGNDHPFGPQRHHAFVNAFYEQGLDQQVAVFEPVVGTDAQVLLFHTTEYLEKVKRLSLKGLGYLDCGDTPARSGIYEAALTVVGTTLAGLDRIMTGQSQHVFIPIAGLHHARHDSAAGFCVFNDCGIAIEALRKIYNIQRIAYVDIDAHHGDGVFYSFESDPDVYFVDIHEDGRMLYPGTGFENETGSGNATGTKLNISMPMNSDDAQFTAAWQRVESFIEAASPEMILFQCGADSLKDDPITHLHYSEAAHAHAAKRLCDLSDRYCQGRILAMGGGGYNLQNIARAWTAIVKVLAEA